jgi:hypothetical protein
MKKSLFCCCREFGMFVKHCKVEIYYTEFLLAELSKPELTVKRKFSKADTLGWYKKKYQGCDSGLTSIRIRIQHFSYTRIRIHKVIESGSKFYNLKINKY